VAAAGDVMGVERVRDLESLVKKLWPTLFSE
jgi:hypothetical protein